MQTGCVWPLTLELAYLLGDGVAILQETERERQGHRQREKQAPCREAQCETRFQDPGVTLNQRQMLNC